MNISVPKKFRIVLPFLLLLFSIQGAVSQINDEIIKAKGKPVKHFVGIHDVIPVSPVKSDKTYIHNIILMIGDGMGAAQVYSGLIANKGHLYITQFPVTGLSKTNSADNLITDSAAGATAISTGIKTDDGYVGIDANQRPKETILEYAKIKGLSTGLVVTSAVTHATPACFIAHVISRDLNEEIAKFFVTGNVDVFIGGGRQFFSSRTDGEDLITKLTNKNFEIITSPAALDTAQSDKIAGLLWEEHGPSVLNGRGDMLPASTKKSIQILSRNPKGFFLMVEGSQIDWGGHQNDTRYLIEEMLDFDKAIGEAVQFASQEGHTLIVVTADHETGGFAITGGSIKKREVVGNFVTDSHTAVWVPVFAFGPGSEIFTGVYENTDIYYKMKSLLDEGLEQEK